MNDSFIDLISDYVFAVISFCAMMVGLDSIPEGVTVVKFVTEAPKVEMVDVTQKWFTIASLAISCVAGLIPIIKTAKSLFKKSK